MEFGQFTDKLFTEAKKKGFKDFEVYFTEGESFKVNVYEGKIDDYSVSGTTGLGFRGIINGKLGYSHTSRLDESSLTMLPAQAAQNAEIIENDDEDTIFEGDKVYTKVDTYSTTLNEVKEEDRIRLAAEMESQAKAFDKKVTRVKHSGISYYSGMSRIRNSKGLSLESKSNAMTAVLIPVVSDGKNMNSGVAYKITRNIGDITPEKLAREAVEDAISYLGAAPAASGVYNIVFKNEAVCDLLETYAGIFSADRAQKGLSLLKGKNGQRIGSETVTLIDDPLLEGGICSCPYDAEGAASWKKETVSGGVLSTLLYNMRTARKDGVATTGNASRASYASPVDISPSNFYLKPSGISFENILKMLGDGLFITELQGLHSGANTVSGDFSLAARGFAVSGGKIGRPVEQITLAGNFYRFLENISAVGSDLKFGMPGDGCFGSPCILVRDLSVAGK